MSTSIDNSPIPDTGFVISSVFPIHYSSINKSVALPNSSKPGFSPVYRNKFSSEALIETPHPSLNTYDKIFRNAVKVYGDNNCFGYRKHKPNGDVEDTFEWLKYTEVDKIVDQVGCGLAAAVNYNPFRIVDDEDDGSFTACLFSHNRWEWVAADLACSRYSIINTALYDTLGADTAEYILELTKSPIVVCSLEKVRTLIKLKVERDVKILTTIVSMDPITDPNLVSYAKVNKIMLYDFKQLRQLGDVYKKDPVPPTPDSIYTISFTSGTTGSKPKGVVLTHRNTVCAITACFMMLSCAPASVTYCFLPLAHIYERMNTGFQVGSGLSIGFPRDSNPLNLISDLKALRPVILTAVPRIYTKIESALKDATISSNSSITKKISSHIINSNKLVQGNPTDVTADTKPSINPIYDLLFNSKLRSKIGFDNLSICCTGSAPISPETVSFLKAGLNIGFIQGYGLTESFAGIALSDPYGVPGSCGAISTTGEMRLMDLPGMGYTQFDEGGSRGELCLRGPQITSGYYKNEAATKEAFDEDGWFHTGDVALIDNDGKLYIIDRVKNFFKLAQGEYVTPEKIENIYLSGCPFITQLFIYGDSLQTYLVGVVGIDFASFKDFLVRNFNLPTSSLSEEKLLEFINKRENKKKLVNLMNEQIASFKLNGFEKLHNIFVDINPLTLERDVVTPTFKLKRALATKFFKKTLDNLYSEGSVIRDSKI